MTHADLQGRDSQSAALVADRSDFPEWVPAMLVKELRQGLRSNAFALILSLLHLMMVLVFVSNIRWDSDINPFGVSENFFWLLVSLLLLGVTPLRGLQELHAEKQSKTLELLSVAGVSATRLVFGKWCSIMVQSGLIALTLTPYFVLRYFSGGVDLLYEARMLGIAVLVSSIFTAAALAISGLKIMVRLAWAAKIVVVNLFLLGFALSGGISSGWMMKAVNAFEWEWLVMIFAAAVGTMIFLRLAGDSLDSPSANGAFLPRLGLITGWLAVPVSATLGLSEGFQYIYIGTLSYLSAWVLIWHMHGHRPILAVQVRPFLRLGPVLGRVAAATFLPNWVGVPLVALMPFLGWLFVIWRVNSDSSRAMLLTGAVCHGAAYLLFMIVIWRLLFASKRDAFGVVAERDPRVILGWIVSISWLVTPLSHALSSPSALRPVGIFLPLFFTWAYLDDSSVDAAHRNEFTLLTATSCSLYFLLSLWLGVRWLSDRGVWRFWNAQPGPRDPAAVPTSGSRPWMEPDSQKAQTDA